MRLAAATAGSTYRLSSTIRRSKLRLDGLDRRRARGSRLVFRQVADRGGDEVRRPEHALRLRRARILKVVGDLLPRQALEHIGFVGRATDRVAIAEVDERNRAGGVVAVDERDLRCGR